ncbi:MAG: hypothetical protein AAFQ51_13475 [Pseudomonadota bacterium]
MARLSGMTLPDDSPFLRDYPMGAGTDTPEFRDRYDRHTLVYDAFFDSEAGCVRMVGPSLKPRLTQMMRGATFKVDGAARPHRLVHVSPRTGMIELDWVGEPPRMVRLFHPALPRFRPVTVNGQELDRFAGKNALVAISKNNDLRWIRDWLTYHVRVHGANAVVLFDNGSDAYRFRQLRMAVGSVPGIDEYAVISAPYPFGPAGVSRPTTNAKFFHLSMLHIAHLRFLARANAVLSVDVDELVVPRSGTPIFDAVKRAEQGFLTFPGTWRYAPKPADAGSVVRHVDHQLARRGRDARMNGKWCVDPMGALQGKYWRVHGIVGGERTARPDYHFLHCRQISTGWDYERGFEPEDRFEPAPEAAFLRKVFDTPTPPTT